MNNLRGRQCLRDLNLRLAEYGYVELVSVRVPDEDVALVRDVDAVGEGRDGLAADAAKELAFLTHHHDAVALEVADVELATEHGDVRRLGHEL